MDKIVCFGKNYADHMTELGDKPVERPVIFLKPPSVMVQCSNWGDKVELHLTREGGEDTHFECEIALKLKEGGYKMSSKQASTAAGWYTLGLDMTLRRLQSQLKKDGHPWTTGKVFPDACVIGPWIEISKESHFLEDDFSFVLDGVERQRSKGRNMIFNPEQLIVYASSFFPLCPGDILFTGTPSGVGQVSKGSVGILKIRDLEYQVSWVS